MVAAEVRELTVGSIHMPETNQPLRGCHSGLRTVRGVAAFDSRFSLLKMRILEGLLCVRRSVGDI